MRFIRETRLAQLKKEIIAVEKRLLDSHGFSYQQVRHDKDRLKSLKKEIKALERALKKGD